MRGKEKTHETDFINHNVDNCKLEVGDDVSNRSSCSKILFTIGFLKNFVNFTGKHLCLILLSIKLQRDANTDVFL